MFAKGPMPGATPKADALKHYPKAYAHQWADCWVIYDGELVNKVVGHGRTAMLAWRDVDPRVAEQQVAGPTGTKGGTSRSAPVAMSVPNTKRELVEWLVRRRQDLKGSISENNHRRLLNGRTKTELKQQYQRIVENERAVGRTGGALAGTGRPG